MITSRFTEREKVEVQFSKEAAVILENHTLEIKEFFFLFFFSPERTGTTGH